MEQADQQQSTATVAKPTPRLLSAHGEFLRSFAVQVVILIAVALVCAGGAAIWIVFNGNRANVVAMAPRVSEALASLISSANIQTKDDLVALGPQMENFPYVERIDVEIRTTKTDAVSGADNTQTLQYHTGDQGPTLIRTQSPIRNANDEVVGRIGVAFCPPALGWLSVAIYTHLGVIAVAALLGYWLLYCRTRRQLRPLEQIQDNLIAYHEGIEPTLDLLTVEDESGYLSDAWNTFVDSIASLRREVERFRCKTAVAANADSNHALHRILLEQLPLGVMRVDDRESITYSNPAAAAMLNFTREGSTGRILSEQVSDATVASKLLEMRSAPPGSSTDLTMTRRNGESVIRVSPLMARGPIEDMTLLLQDVSQLVQAERSRDDFLAHITHELRTPLTNIRAYVETLSQDFLEDENARRECYNVIMSETRRLSKLIEDVLSVSQIEAGGTRLVRTNVRVEELLRQTAQEMQAAADAKNITLNLKIPSKVPMVPGDRHRLHQVWTNLIGNAIKYTPANERVTVEVETEGSRLAVRVTDTGIGIAPEHHEKIFDKFYRVGDEAVSATEGTGLGLAITREILRIHGGTIRVESTAGKGSTFIVELPTAKAVENEIFAG